MERLLWEAIPSVSNLADLGAECQPSGEPHNDNDALARWTAPRRTAQNFAFVFPSPASVFILFPSLVGPFRGILVV